MNAKNILIGISIALVIIFLGFRINQIESNRIAEMNEKDNTPFYQRGNHEKKSFVKDTILEILASSEKLSINDKFLVDCESLYGNNNDHMEWSDFFFANATAKDSTPFLIKSRTLNLANYRNFLKVDPAYGYLTSYHCQFRCDSFGTIKSTEIILGFGKKKVREDPSFSVSKSYANVPKIRQREKELNAKRERELANQQDKAEEEKVKKTASLGVLKFKSTLNDVEEAGVIIHTNHETTYHTFDFDNLTITQEGENSSGEWLTFTYPMKTTYKDGYNYVIVVNDNGIKEAWFVLLTNALGYDLTNGQRLAFYGITRIK